MKTHGSDSIIDIDTNFGVSHIFRCSVQSLQIMFSIEAQIYYEGFWLWLWIAVAQILIAFALNIRVAYLICMEKFVTEAIKNGVCI